MRSALGVHSRSFLPCGAAFVSTAVISFADSTARAEPPTTSAPATLAWDAPEGCPDASRVRAAVEAMVGTHALERREPYLTATGKVTESGGRFALRLQLDARGLTEVKTLEADSCERLADAYAVVVAFALDPTAGQSAPAAGGPGVLSTTATPSEPSHESFAPTDRTQASRTTPRALAIPRATETASSEPCSRMRLVAGPLVATGAGLLPMASYGLGARVALEAVWRWELAGTFWPDRSVTVSTDASHTLGARVGFASVIPSACREVSGRWAAVCLGAEAGAMRATGAGGVAFPRRGSSWWLAIVSGVALRVALAPAVDLRVRLDVGVPLFRPSFVLEDVGSSRPVQAYQPAPVYAVLSVQPEIRFFSTDPGETRHAGK